MMFTRHGTFSDKGETSLRLALAAQWESGAEPPQAAAKGWAKAQGPCSGCCACSPAWLVLQARFICKGKKTQSLCILHDSAGI